VRTIAFAASVCLQVVVVVSPPVVGSLCCVSGPVSVGGAVRAVRPAALSLRAVLGAGDAATTWSLEWCSASSPSVSPVGALRWSGFRRWRCVAAGQEMLVPVTEALFVPGTLASSTEVLVDIGTGYFVKKSIPGAVKILDKKV
jgi:hypothetical protein